MQFSDIGLTQSVLRALGDAGYDSPTAIQALAIPHVLVGRDLLGCAHPGTGKTGAFALPILERLAGDKRPEGRRTPRVLVLTPTDALASQIGACFRSYGRYTELSHAVVIDDADPVRQITALARDIDVLIATPRRLLDLVERRAVSLVEVGTLVLDAADLLIDQGCFEPIERITRAIPEHHQTLLFASSMSSRLRTLADVLLSNPIEVSTTPLTAGEAVVEQSIYFVEKADKRRLLAWLLQERYSGHHALVFTRTKHGSKRVVDQLKASGICAVALYNDQTQALRDQALAHFGAEVRVLATTDTAARGVSLGRPPMVVNYDLPNAPESYLQRLERACQAGAKGYAVSFCESEERSYLKNIERAIGTHIPVIAEHPFPSPHGLPIATDLDTSRRSRSPGPQHSRLRM